MMDADTTGKNAAVNAKNDGGVALIEGRSKPRERRTETHRLPVRMEDDIIVEIVWALCVCIVLVTVFFDVWPPRAANDEAAEAGIATDEGDRNPGDPEPSETAPEPAVNRLQQG